MQTFSNQDLSSYYNYKNRAYLLRGYFEFVKEQEIKWHLTANFNRETTHVQGKKILKHWAARVDHDLHGRNFHKKSIDERMFFIAFPEIGGESGHLHYHILAKTPVSSEGRLERVAVVEWKRLVKTGDLLAEQLEESDIEIGSAISYGLKDMWRNNGLEEIVLSTEFAPIH